MWQTQSPCQETWFIVQMFMQLRGLYRHGEGNMEEHADTGVLFVTIKKGEDVICSFYDFTNLGTLWRDMVLGSIWFLAASWTKYKKLVHSLQQW